LLLATKIFILRDHITVQAHRIYNFPVRKPVFPVKENFPAPGAQIGNIPPDSPDIIKLQKTFHEICSQLSEKKRKVLELHMAGMPQKEIAAYLKTSHAYIRKMMHEIRNEIKSLFLNDPEALRVVEVFILDK